MWRLSILFTVWERGDTTERRRAEVGIPRILVREDGLSVDGISRAGEKFMEEMADALRQAMRPPMPDVLQDCGDFNSGPVGTGGFPYVWSA